MNSSTAKSLPSSNVQDPITALPQEIFLQFFKHLDSKELLDSESISKSWRETIQSCPSLYSTLIIDLAKRKLGTGIPDEQKKTVTSTKLFKWLFRYSVLSRNQLKEVDISTLGFAKDAMLSSLDWHSTQLSVVFNLLSFSSGTLKSLTLKLPSNSNDLGLEIQHVCRIIKESESFRALRVLRISSHVAIGLVSGDYDSKLIEIQDSSQLYQGRAVGIDPDYSLLIEAVMRFSQEGIRRYANDWRVELGSEALTKLKESTEYLEEINFEANGSSQSLSDIFRIALLSPNLVEFNFTLMDEVHETESILLEIPKGSNFVSRLEQLYITFGRMAGVKLNEEFWRWVGGDLVTLWLSGFSTEERRGLSSLASASFHSFLTTSSHHLNSISLDNLSLPDFGRSNVQLQLHQLQVLSVGGDLNLISFFLGISFDSLTELSFRAQDSSNSEALEHSKILKVLRSCERTLRFLQIDVLKLGEETCHIKSSGMGTSELDEGNQEMTILPSLPTLYFGISDECISKFYLPIRFPKLKSVYLPRKSGLSSNSFYASNFKIIRRRA